jgi:hypothetical protein
MTPAPKRKRRMVKPGEALRRQERRLRGEPAPEPPPNPAARDPRFAELDRLIADERRNWKGRGAGA